MGAKDKDALRSVKLHFRNYLNADIIEFCVGKKEYSLGYAEEITVEVYDGDCVYFDGVVRLEKAEPQII